MAIDKLKPYPYTIQIPPISPNGMVSMTISGSVKLWVVAKSVVIADNFHHDKRKIIYRSQCCESIELIKNGHSNNGKQQYICNSCGRRGVVNPKARHSDEEKEQILTTYFKGPSMRGLCRLFKVSRPTLVKWLKKSSSEP